MARMLFNTIISLLCMTSSAYFTREEVNQRITRDSEGVFFLNEQTFDDFINYNDLVLIVFYEIGDMQPILKEYLLAIDRRVQDTQTLF